MQAKLGFTSCSEDVEYELELAFPQWLQGAYIKNGPGMFESPVTGEKISHWFDGLAMLSKVSFSGEKASFQSRFIRESEAYKQAQKNKRFNYLSFGTAYTRGWFDRLSKFFLGPKPGHNTCVNTVKMGEHYLALSDIPTPVEFDINTLESIKLFEYETSLKPRVSSSHPQIMGSTIFNIVAEYGRTCSYYVYAIDAKDPRARQRVIAQITTDKPAMMHSFAMTENYVILIETPYRCNTLGLRFGNLSVVESFSWDPTLATRLYVVEKNSGKVERLETEPFFYFHTVNAFEQANDIVLDLCALDDATIVNDFYLDNLRSSHYNQSKDVLTRLRLRNKKQVVKEQLADFKLDMPSSQPSCAGKPYSICYGVSSTADASFSDQLVRYDIEQAATRIWQEDGCYPGEPLFIPKPGGEEGDGVIISIVLDASTARSFVLLLDASSYAEISRAYLKSHIPFGFHGCFYPRTIQ